MKAIPADLQQFLPLDKSWMIRLGVLDLLHGYTDMEEFLEELDQAELGTDLQALMRASKQWRQNLPIDVGESGTLLRFLQYAAWKQNKPVTFVKRGTLRDRPMVNNPAIVKASVAELLELDNGTSQWASAAVLLGNKEKPPKPLPYKLALTYEAVKHWQDARGKGKRWQPRYDQTIEQQALAYINWLDNGTMHFTPEQAEDYCFARAFQLMDATEGEERWPSLRQHESDRIESMEIALTQDIVDSADHRVIQAVALRLADDVTFTNPGAVSKSWPLFWKFYDYTRRYDATRKSTMGGP